MKLTILAFGAHPDDVEISAGGLLCSESAKGNKIGVIDLTLGELGTRGNPEIRIKEAEKAAEIMGCEVRENLEMRDGFFANDEQHQLKVIQAIRKYRPDIVLANAPYDRHPDHGRAGQLVKEAVFLAGLRKIDTNQEAWRPSCFYHYMQFYIHPANFIYDISNVLEQKLACILAHESQFYNPNSNEPETVIASKHFKDNLVARASEYGLQAGFAFGEPFITIKPLGVRDITSLK